MGNRAEGRRSIIDRSLRLTGLVTIWLTGEVLPPGQYIDELRDFLERLASAKPDDESAIRAEIRRYYYNVGDTIGGDTLNRAFSEVLEAGADKEWRQQLLDSIAAYAKTDPAQMGLIYGAVPGLILASPGIAAEGLEITPGGAAQSTERAFMGGPESGGRLGSVTTRALNANIAADLEGRGFTIIGGGQLPEEIHSRSGSWSSGRYLRRYNSNKQGNGCSYSHSND